MSGGKHWETNLAAAWGQMTTGGGHKPLAEKMVILGVPIMTKRSFMTTEKKIGELRRDLFEQSKISARKEERDTAIANKQLVPPSTSSHCDCWWGVVKMHSQTLLQCIIGKATGKYYIWEYAINFVQFVIDILSIHLPILPIKIVKVLLLVCGSLWQ